MAAFSYSIKRGVDGFSQVNFTHGTLAPNADDIELRVNTADANAAAMTIKDIIKALEAFERAIQDGTKFKSDWGI
jgi:hypothetical protein